MHKILSFCDIAKMFVNVEQLVKEKAITKKSDYKKSETGHEVFN
jgi:hypothetical protein